MAKPERKIANPDVNPETRAYWEAAAQGTLLVPRCKSCGEAHWYPRALCPFCFSDVIEAVPSSGTGVIYSYSVMRRAPEPYAVAYVTLTEGPIMLSNLVDCDFNALRIGQAVKLVFKPSENGQNVPMFTLA